jgi:hypothetical protein
MLAFAVEQVAFRLPLFERHHAAAAWPRAWLAGLAAHETLEAGDLAVLEQEYSGPGGGSFVKAMEALRETSMASTPAARALSATDAIAEAIMSEVMEAGGTEHPDLWSRWYTEAIAGAEPTDPLLLARIFEEPKAADIDRAGWRSVADALEQRTDRAT